MEPWHENHLWGLNIWAGGREDLHSRPESQPEVDIFLVGGLASDPRRAWYHNPASVEVGPSALYDSGAVMSMVSLLSHSGSRDRSDDSADDFDFVPVQSLEYEDVQSIASESAGCFWPLQLLPNDFHKARIGTYAYQSQWNSDRFTADIEECGEKMLADIARARQTQSTRSRPIIFVGHSFGGLVIQSALLSAAEDPTYKSIRESCKGIIFLGTPFQGTRLATALSMLNRTRRNKQPIIDALKPNNAKLRDLQERFKTVFGNGDWRNPELICFYEKWKSLRGSALVVSRESACLAGFPNVKNLPMHADHRGMNKYRDRNDHNYQLLKDHIRPIYEKCINGRGSADDFAVQSYEQRHRPNDGSSASRNKPLPTSIPQTWPQGSRLSRKTLPNQSSRDRASRRASGSRSPGYRGRDSRHGVGEQKKLHRVEEEQPFGRIPTDLLESFNAIQRAKGQPPGIPKTPVPRPAISREQKPVSMASTNDQWHRTSAILQRNPFTSMQTQAASRPEVLDVALKSRPVQHVRYYGHTSCQTPQNKSPWSPPATSSTISSGSISPVASPVGSPTGMRASQTQCRMPADLQESSRILGLPCNAAELPANSVPASKALRAARPGATAYSHEPQLPVIVEPISARPLSLPLTYGSLLSSAGIHGNELPSSRIAIAGLPKTGRTFCAQAFARQALSSLRKLDLVNIETWEDEVSVSRSSHARAYTTLWHALDALQQATGEASERKLIVVDQITEQAQLDTLQDWCEIHLTYGDCVLLVTTRLDIATTFLRGGGIVAVAAVSALPDVTLNVAGNALLASDFLPADWIYHPSIVQRILSLLEGSKMPTSALHERLNQLLAPSEWLQNESVQLAFEWAANMFYNGQWPTNDDLGGNGDSTTLFHVLTHCVEPSWLRVLDQVAEAEPEVINVLEVIVLIGDTSINPKQLARMKAGNAVAVLQEWCIINTVEGRLKEPLVKCTTAMNIVAKVWLTNDRLRASQDT